MRPGRPVYDGLLTAPYLYLRAPDGTTAPYTPSAGDLLSPRWDIVHAPDVCTAPPDGMTLSDALRTLLYRDTAVTCHAWNLPGQHLHIAPQGHPCHAPADPRLPHRPWTPAPRDVFSDAWTEIARTARHPCPEPRHAPRQAHPPL